MHLAVGYAAIANGGLHIQPSLLRGRRGRTRACDVGGVCGKFGKMLRGVTDGTASMGKATGYAVAGKTGTRINRSLRTL